MALIPLTLVAVAYIGALACAFSGPSGCGDESASIAAAFFDAELALFWLSGVGFGLVLIWLGLRHSRPVPPAPMRREPPVDKPRSRT